MKKALLSVLVLSLILVSPALARATRPVNMFVVVPPTYVSPITPEQAWISAITWLGTPADAPCLDAVSCTIEGYFRSQLGKVFDYNISIVSGAYPQPGPGGTDACGQGGIDSYWYRSPVADYSLDDNRTFVLVLGGGGWAGHNPVRTGPQKGSAFGMIGDWGVQNMWNVPLPCVPEWVGEPFMDRGFAHEFEGMMGAFKNATYGYFCCEHPYEADHRRNVLTYSREWLRDP